MIEWTATILTLIGGIFVVQKSRWGYIMWIVANMLWIWLQASKGIWGMVVCMLFNTGISVWGFIEWSKNMPVIGELVGVHFLKSKRRKDGNK